MSLFSVNRQNNDPIEYTTIEHDASYNIDEHQGESQSYQDNVAISRTIPDTSNRGVSGANKSEGANYHILETSQTPSEKTSGSNNGPTMAGWPQGPRQLRGVSIPYLIGDTLLILLPVAFLVLSISAWKLDGKVLSDTGKMVKRAMNLGPTIYPLAFSAIGSRCLRSIAVHLAERGTTISTLEKLLGSQSLVSAIGTAFTLRSANLVSIALLLLWALSPLGGQSSLRLLHETNSTVSETGTIYYSDAAARINLEEASTWFTLIPTVLGASLAVSEDVKNRPVDLWSHPKVPRLDIVEQNVLSIPDAESDWISVDTNMNRTYASWIGVNIQGLLPSKQATFQVKSNYISLDCKKLYGGTAVDVAEYLQSPNISIFPSLNPPNESLDPDVDASQRLFNANVFPTSKGDLTSFSFFLRTAWNSTDSGKSKNQTLPNTIPEQQPISFLYGANYILEDKSVLQMHSCTPSVVTIDARINCQIGDCEVTQVRNIPSDVTSKCLTGSEYTLDCLKTDTYTSHMFLRYFPVAVTAGYSSAEINPFDDFIAGSNVTYRTVPSDYRRNLEQIPDKMISDRLTTLLNTYWQAAAWGTQVTRAGLFDKPQYPWNGSVLAPERWINTTEAVFSHQVPVYRADVGWVISLIIITIILLLLAITNVVMTFLTIAPDLFYYASSLARENPYTNTPDGGTALDGAERSRLLKEMKVQVADVSPENEVGYMALKSVADGEDFVTGRLKKGRSYW